MTLISDIVSAAWKETNDVALESGPTEAESEHARLMLTRILHATLRFLAGQKLPVWAVPPIKGSTTRYNYPLGNMDRNPVADDMMPFPPTNRTVRAVTDYTVFLDPFAEDGAQMVFTVANPGAVLTVNPNGLLIDDSASLTVTGPGQAWLFFRSDLGKWITILPSYGFDDEMPFPPEYDDYFTVLLSLRLTPLTGREPNAVVMSVASQGESDLRARYFQNMPVALDSEVFSSSDKRGDWF